MSKDHAREYIISYDIADPKRLGKIHRLLKKLAIPLQYSVFYTRMTERQREKLAQLLDKKICPQEDDIRIYPLPAGYNVDYLGTEPFLEGLYPQGQKGQWTAAIDNLLDTATRDTPDSENT